MSNQGYGPGAFIIGVIFWGLAAVLYYCGPAILFLLGLGAGALL